MESMKKWFREKQFQLGAIFLYTLLTIAMTWPLASQLGTHIPGRFGDAWVHAWTFHWIKEALLTGQNPFYTELLFYPNGVTLFFHNIAWINIAIWLPLQALVGEWTAYGLVFMLVYIFNAFATCLLAWEWTKSRLAAFVAGLVVGFWPYILSRTDTPNLILVGFISLFLLYLSRLFAQQNRRNIILSAVFLALIGYARWQLLIIGGVLIVVFVLYHLAANKAVRNLKIMQQLAAVGGIALLLMTPLLGPLVYAQVSRDYPGDIFVEESLKHTDLLSYVLPSGFHPLWGEQIEARYPDIFNQEEYAPFVGYSVLLLGLLGVFTQRKRARVWWIGAVVLVVLALGVVFVVNGRNYPIPLPYRLIQGTFLSAVIRQPIRFNAILSIPMAMLAACGVVTIVQRISKKSLVYGFVSLVSILILFEYARPNPTLALEIPDWYQTVVASAPDEFGIFGVPMNPRLSPDKFYMFYQTEHGKPLVEGHVSRIPQEATTLIDAFYGTDSLGARMEMLHDANVRYVVLHKQLAWTGDIVSWRHLLGREPDFEDEAVVVYEVARFLEIEESIAYPVMDGLGVLGQVDFAETAVSGGSLPITLLWGNYQLIDADYDACFQLLDANGNSVQTACEPLAACTPTSSWHSVDLVRSNYVFRLDEALAEGTYQLAVSVKLAGSETLADSAILGEVAVIVDRGDVGYELETAVWGNAQQIALTSYDVVNEGENVAVSLYWQSQKPTDVSYKVFLHLINQDNGEIVSQLDFVPDNWVYPTNNWQCGEIVRDQVVLPFTDAPSGNYVVSVGLYDTVSGERLVVTKINGQSASEQSVNLATLRK